MVRVKIDMWPTAENNQGTCFKNVCVRAIVRAPACV